MKADDVLPKPSDRLPLLDAISRTRGAIELKLVSNGEAIEMNTSRRAFIVDMKKEHAMPGINALGGGYFEGEQEITGLGRVLPHRVIGSLSQAELEAPIAPWTPSSPKN